MKKLISVVAVLMLTGFIVGCSPKNPSDNFSSTRKFYINGKLVSPQEFYRNEKLVSPDSVSSTGNFNPPTGLRENTNQSATLSGVAQSKAVVLENANTSSKAERSGIWHGDEIVFIPPSEISLFAKDTKEIKYDGALISGGNVTIRSRDGDIGGILNNTGTIEGQRSVVITSKQINNGTSTIGGPQATITAGELINIDASSLETLNNNN